MKPLLKSFLYVSMAVLTIVIYTLNESTDEQETTAQQDGELLDDSEEVSDEYGDENDNQHQTEFDINSKYVQSQPEAPAPVEAVADDHPVVAVDLPNPTESLGSSMIRLPTDMKSDQTEHQQLATSLEMSLAQKSRLLQASEACKRLNITQTTVREMKEAGVLDNMFVDDRRRYIFCRIGKVASTTWSRVLLIASGQLKKDTPNSLSQPKTYAILQSGSILRALSRYTNRAISRLLKEYFKFVFVRHPLDRMISAYNDRLKSDHSIPKKIYNHYIKMNYRRPGDKKGQGVTLQQFVRYVVDPKTKRKGYNPHWRPQYDRSLPCDIQYDFIGHYENLQEDAKYVLQRIGADAKVTFPLSDPDNRHLKMNATERLARKLMEIPDDDLQRLKTDVYDKDFAIFGYELSPRYLPDA